MGKTGDRVSILGYGCMRFKQKGGRLDEEKAERQILLSIDKGVNYFDTAYMYNGGRSESLLGKVLSKGYRSKVKIATKLPLMMVRSKKEMEDILEAQLKKLNTDHIDYYLMHGLKSVEVWNTLKEYGVLEFLEKAKKEGKILHTGFSYHGTREDFKPVVDGYDWDICQIQYNYMDENNQAGKLGLEYAASKGLGVVVMEPLRGGCLAGNVPCEVRETWERANIKRTPVEWALRWIWDHPQVTTLLSGMNDEAQIEENTRVASEAYPKSLKPEEIKLFEDVKEIYEKLMKIGCTGCGYCMPCPAGVDIPTCFAMYNSKYLFNDPKARFQYTGFMIGLGGSKPSYASQCVECGKCEKVCPQNLPIRKHLKQVTRELQVPFMKSFIYAADKILTLRSRLKGHGNKRR